MTQGQFLSGVWQVWIQSFPSRDLLPHECSRTSLSYYLPIAGGRIIGFIPFPRVLVLCKMQSVSSRIWTRTAVFISYDDNHYTTGVMIHNQADELKKNCDVSLLSRQRVFFLFLSISMWQATNHMSHSFFLFPLNFFSFFKDYNKKRQISPSIHSFFLFFFFFKYYM